MATTVGKTGWLFAEAGVLLSGLFVILISFSLPYPVLEELPYVLILPPIVPAVATVSFTVWRYRGKISNSALTKGAVLACYSWLQLWLPIGFGWAFIRIAIMLVLMVGVFHWLLPNTKPKQSV